MNQKHVGDIIRHIDHVLSECEHVLRNNLSPGDLSQPTYDRLIIRIKSVIIRASGENSPYHRSVSGIDNRHFSSINTPTPRNKIRLNSAVTVLDALKSDISMGFLISISELVNAEIFSDFLEMAEHLLEENYKDPAAVIIGSVLEEHVRKLCTKSGIPIEVPDSRGVLRTKKADSLNSELASASVYNKLDQKNVTAWLDLRNKAAHGQYTEYTKEQVDLLLQSVRDFITRHPA